MLFIILLLFSVEKMSSEEDGLQVQLSTVKEDGLYVQLSNIKEDGLQVHLSNVKKDGLQEQLSNVEDVTHDGGMDLSDDNCVLLHCSFM